MKTSLRSLGGLCGQCQPSLRRVNGVIAVAIWVLGIGVLCYLSEMARPPVPGLFFVPFVMWPHAITHLAVLNAKDGKGQCCLFAAQIIYAIWVGAACVAMFSAPTTTAPVDLLVVAFKAFPALGVLWLAALFCHLRKRHAARFTEVRSVA